MSGDTSVDLALRRMLDQIKTAQKRAVTTGVNGVVGQALAEAEAAVEAHARTVQNTHGVGTGMYVAKTRDPSQLPDWRDLINKPDPLEFPVDWSLARLDADAIVSGTLEIARLPVAGPGETDAELVVRSDDPRLSFERFEVPASETLTTGDWVTLHEVLVENAAPQIRCKRASAALTGPPAVGFVLETYAAGEAATIWVQGRNIACFLPDATTEDIGRSVYLSATPGRSTLVPPLSETTRIQALGHVVGVSDSAVAVLLRWSIQIRMVAETPTPPAVARRFAADVGDGVATVIALAHSLETRDVVVQVRANSPSYGYVGPDVVVVAATTTTVTLTFAIPPLAGQYRCIITG